MEIQLLLQFKEKLVSLFESDKVSEFLLSHRVISRDTHDRVNLLDGDLPPRRKGRYLYQQVCDRISEDEGVFNRLVEFLKTWEGGASQGRAVAKELVRVKEGKMETGLMGGGCLEEKDIPGLLKTIPDCHKWEEIGLALSLPECVREECRKKSSDVLRFSAVLLAWVRFCGGKGVKPATVDSLRDALKSNIVNLYNCAQKLEAWQRVLPEEGHSVEISLWKFPISLVILKCLRASPHFWRWKSEVVVVVSPTSGVKMVSHYMIKKVSLAYLVICFTFLELLSVLKENIYAVLP